MLALTYVAATVREFDGTITEQRCRSIMGSLGLIGEKSIRPIGSLSGGEKARVALATFCLTPYNVLLLDEPTNPLDVDAIAAMRRGNSDTPATSSPGLAIARLE